MMDPGSSRSHSSSHSHARRASRHLTDEPQVYAVSSSNAASGNLRSSPSSPIPAPSSPSPTDGGLSRRQSWNQGEGDADETFRLSPGSPAGAGQGTGSAAGWLFGSSGVSGPGPSRGHGHSYSLAPPSSSRLVSQDADLGARGEYGRHSGEYGRSFRQARSGAGDVSEDAGDGNAGLGLSLGQRPFFHRVDSTSSFDAPDGDDDDHPHGQGPSRRRSLVGEEDEEENDRSHLSPSAAYSYGQTSLSGSVAATTGAGGGGTPTRSPRRPYDSHGFAPARSPRALAASVSRSPTFRAVSQSLRQAGSRVASFVSSEPRGSRLVGEDGEDGAEVGGERFEMMGKRVEEPEEIERGKGAERTETETVLSPEKTRGRTLGLFGPESKVRRAMYAMMVWPWTEPIILGLIILYTVVLAVQSAQTLHEPRPRDGFFQRWEDTVILILFVIFTVEMFARIVLTGLIFDPESSAHAWFFGERGLIHLLRIRAQSRGGLHRSTTAGPTRAAWRSVSDKHQPSRKATILPEAPFQSAVLRQIDLAHSARPYLRHSWHRIDMLAIVCFWISFFLAATHQEATDARHLYIFRAISVLRAARLLVITSGTATILRSLKRAAPLLVTVGFFFIFASALWSIIGIQSFQGSFRRSCLLTDPNNASNVIDLGQTCGGYVNATTMQTEPYINLEGVPQRQGPKGYICPLGQAGEENPEGDNESFDNFFYALIQVIIIASINTWAPVMYKAMDSDYFFSALYWIVGVIIINFWLINLVVAVVVNTFKGVRADTHKSAFGADDSAAAVDPSWTAPTQQTKDNRLIKWYRHTELFWVAIVVASLVTQATKTSNSSPQHIELTNTIELAFTLAFDIEMAIRIAAHFPDWRGFVRNPRNMFDLFLAVTTSIIQIPAISSDAAYLWLTVFQLARWYRFVLVFPRMKPLLMRLFGSFAGLLNMTVFLIMMIFLSALVAVQLFCGDIEEGEFITFSQTYNAFLGMYQLFSSEDWSGVMYNAMEASDPFQQKWLAAIFLCAWLVFAFFILLQMFVAVINENFQVAEEQKRKKQVEDFIRRGEPQSAHVSWIDRLNPYRLMKAKHSAVRVSALPESLVLPLKHTGGVDVGHASDRAAVTGAEYTKQKLSKMLGRSEDGLRKRRRRPVSDLVLEDEPDEPGDDRGLSDILPSATNGPAPDAARDAERERRNQQADFIAAHPSFDRSVWVFKQSNPIRRFCQACFDPAYGDRIYGRQPHPVLRLLTKSIIFATVAASIVVAAISTPAYRKQWYETNGYVKGSWFELVEGALSSVFLVEAIMKVIADGFIFAPNAYLLSIWNIIDFLILNALVVNVVTTLVVVGGVNRLTRALRAVRALRLITLFSRLRDTLHVVLFAGFAKLADASVLMVLYLIPFAVWGWVVGLICAYNRLNIFSGRLYRCNDENASGYADCFGEFEQSPMDDSLGYLTPRVWSNPGIDDSTTAWSFDSFRESMLILFEIVSLEGWVDVMESVVQIVGIDLQPQDFASQANSIFFLIFHLFGGAIILTLFVSIIIENFSMSSGMALLTTEQRSWVDLSKYIKAQTPSQLPRQRPQDDVRSWCYERATDKYGWWARSFTVLYYLHILLLAFEDFEDTIMTELQFDIIFLVLTMIYAVDLLVRFVGVGFKSFKANGWNIFDLIVIAGSFATTIPALRSETTELGSNQVNVQLQKLFLVAIALKLVQRNGSLNQLFKTSVASLPAIGNLFLLWACLFIFYAIMYLEIFGLTKLGNNSESRFENYYTFRNALVMLAFMSTGEGWNGYMHDYTVIAPRCVDSDNFLDSDCGSSAWSYVLFISWNIMSMYIFLNMFTGVVVESFAYVYQMPGGASLDRDQMRAFKRLWAEFDTQRTGYLRRKDFVPFFSRLSGVFEIRPYPAEYSVHNLLRACIPDPIENASGKVPVATGVKRAIDTRQLHRILGGVDRKVVRERRQTFTRLFYEVRIAEETGRGISFTSMLFLLAHYCLINDEEALLLDDLIVRRVRMERIDDLVSLDRVRGLLKTVYWRRRFIQHRDQQKRTLNAQAEGIPAIVLEPMASSPEMGFDGVDQMRSGESSRSNSPPSSPGAGSRHSPSLSVTGSPSRRVSDTSMLSTDDRRWRDSISDDGSPQIEDGSSMWGDMMKEAVEKDKQRS